MPPPVTPSQDYYVRAASWAGDERDGLRRSRTIAWIVAALLGLVAGLEAIALAALAPLKTVVPYTLLVDRQTGFVQALKGLEPEKISADAALTQSQLAQYVVAREDFDAATLGAQYRKVALWSAQDARRDYLRIMASANPENPFRRYPRGAVLATRVKSVSPVGPGAAMVRFETERRDDGQAANEPQAFVAMIRFRHSGAPMSLDDRLLNPLGFQVIDYRRAQEALTPEPSRALSDEPLDVAP